MSNLKDKKCVPCEGGIIPFNISEIHKYQKKVDGWNILKNEKNIFFIEKNFKFKNFKYSQNFVNKVGEISEEEGHHPQDQVEEDVDVLRVGRDARRHPPTMVGSGVKSPHP